jgi:Bacterial Ig domain
MMRLHRSACFAVLLSVFSMAWPSLCALAQLGGILGGGGIVVTVTSPASGSNVSGTIPVRASTTVPVAGVQLRLDGIDLGAEDTSAPYAISWNTTTAANGPHSLTAVARDALGIRYFSDPVAVTVANAPPPPPPPNVQRFEDSNASVIYTAGWTQGDTSRAWSSGTAALSATPGARATFTFTGPSVTWVGGRNASTGIANVYLDGVFAAEVDTSQWTEEVRATMFTLSGLAATTHTLTIEATGRKNPAATSSLIVIDAFDVPAPAVSRLQETDPDITYTGAWAPDSTRSWSAGAAVLTAAPGAQATFPFTGTAVTWIGARCSQCGIARVFLDGNFVADVNAYSATEQIQAALFTATGIADAPHTLTITSTGTQNPAAIGSLVVIDAFEVTTAGIMVQETDPAIGYGAGWVLGIRDHAYNQAITAESNTLGARATFTFTGTGISWVSARGPQTGMARVYIDGAFVTEIDTYAPTESPQHTTFSRRGLAAGNHALTMEVSGRNPASRDAWILIDAFVVVP